MYQIWEQNEDEYTEEVCGKIIPRRILDRTHEIPSWCPLEEEYPLWELMAKKER